MSDVADYLARCAMLRDRGLPGALVYQLQHSGNASLLDDIEALDDAAIAELSQVWEDREAAAERVSRAAADSAYAPPALVGEQEPLLWEGDQA